MRVGVIELLLDCRDRVLGVGVPLPDGVADHHDAGPVWLQQKLTRGLLQQSVKRGIGSAEHGSLISPLSATFKCCFKYTHLLGLPTDSATLTILL